MVEVVDDQTAAHNWTAVRKQSDGSQVESTGLVRPDDPSRAIDPHHHRFEDQDKFTGFGLHDITVQQNKDLNVTVDLFPKFVALRIQA